MRLSVFVVVCTDFFVREIPATSSSMAPPHGIPLRKYIFPPSTTEEGKMSGSLIGQFFHLSIHQVDLSVSQANFKSVRVKTTAMIWEPNGGDDRDRDDRNRIYFCSIASAFVFGRRRQQGN